MVGPGVASASQAAAAPGFFGSISQEWAKLSTFEKVGLGFKGASGAGSLAMGNANAIAQRAAIAFQEGEAKTAAAGDKLEIAERELEAQRKLRRVLATQQVQASASGVTASPELADASYYEAGRESDFLDSRRALLDERGGLASSAFSLRRRSAARRGVGSGVGSLLDFGADAARTFTRSRGVE